MVTTDVELDLRLQLKEAGRLLSNPSESIDELLHVLDQLEKLLSMVDQSPNNIMQEALSHPMKSLVGGSLLEHSNMDVKVSVASCLCEITRITAPEAPYGDEEMKSIFQCIVSSLENLSDKSSRSYAKRVSILETVSKVRACVIMLDLECDDLIVKLFEHFLNSVRDHHLDRAFSLMANIMALVLEESDEISLDMLKPLLASIKKNSEGVLPVARNLGEEVIKRSADKLRPYVSKAITIWGDSLIDYSQLLTSVCEGTTDFIEHNDESASVQPKVVDTVPTIVSLDNTDQVSNKEMENVGLANEKPDGAVPCSNSTSKLDTNDSVAEKSGNVESKPDKTTKFDKPIGSETVHGEDRAEKSPEIVVSVQQPLQSEVANAPSQSGSQQEESQSKILIKKGSRSKKKGLSQTDPPSTVAVLIKLNEGGTGDPDMRSPKRIRKKTPKAEENNPSVTIGSDVESPKTLGKKVETGDSVPKQAKRPGKKAGGGGSVAKKPKMSGKKASELKKSKEDDKKVVEAGDSEVKSAKQSLKKGSETDSDAKPLKQSGKKADKKVVEAGDSEVKSSKQSLKKGSETDSDAKLLKQSGKKADKKVMEAGDLEVKSSKQSLKKGNETDSDAKPLKKSRKRADKKVVEAGDSEVKSAKGSLKKGNETDADAKPLKQSGKTGKRRKVITKPSEDNANKDKEIDSDNKPLEPSENREEKTDSDNKPLKPSEKRGEETDSDNKPLKPLENKEEETDSDNKPLKPSENKEEETDSDNIPLKESAKRRKKNISSVIKSSLKDKDSKQESVKNIEEKDQTKSLSEDDDGMDVALKTVLNKATKRKGSLEGALSTSSKKKRSTTKNKVTETIKYDDSLVGQKVKVWWPDDKMYYEGVVESFDSAMKKHKVSYVDGDEEILNLRKEKWEILKEFSSPNKEVAVEAQNADILPEIVGSSEGDSKVESKEDEETKKDKQKNIPQKIVYSRGKKGSKSKTKFPDDNVKESVAGDAAEAAESQKEKSTETPKIRSKVGNKKKKMN